MNPIFSLLFRNLLPFALSTVCGAQGIETFSGHTKSFKAEQLQRESVQLQRQEFVFHQLLIGGEWNSSIKFTNRGTRGSADTPATLEILDTTNRIVKTINLTPKAGETQLLTLHVLAPETVGIQGTLALRTPNTTSLIIATGLRINPSNRFTPIRAVAAPR